MSNGTIIKNPEINPIYQENPAFSFKYLIQGKYDLKSNLADKNLRIKLLDKLRKYSQQSWVDLNGLDKKNGGIETIKLNELRDLKVNLPSKEFYNNVDKITVFRISTGDDGGRIVGYRKEKLCYILWLDWNFTSYNHGS